jgi:hypothetical protein
MNGMKRWQCRGFYDVALPANRARAVKALFLRWLMATGFCHSSQLR